MSYPRRYWKYCRLCLACCCVSWVCRPTRSKMCPAEADENTAGWPERGTTGGEAGGGAGGGATGCMAYLTRCC